MSGLVRTLSLARRSTRNFLSKRPLCISFEITHSCNARCRHCHLGGPVEEERAPAEKLGEICRELSPVVAQISGGEPLLRRDLAEIVKAFRVKKRAPFIVVTTNASLLDESRYHELKEAGVDEFSISLDYPDDRQDGFRGIPGLFRRIESLMNNLDGKEDKGVTLCCVVQSDNYRDLVKLAELARSWGVKINFSAYTWLRTKNKNYMLSGDQLGEFGDIVQSLIRFKKGFGTVRTSKFAFLKMAEYFGRRCAPNCMTGERFFNVNPDGTLSPCGLIIKDFKTRRELREHYRADKSCIYCLTSIRANTEKPAWHALKDSLAAIRR